FLVKPYDVRELLARIEAVTRRTHILQPGQEHSVELGDLTVDHVSRQLRVAGVDAELTGKEFDIMAVLARYPGVVVSRERLIREVWKSDWHAFSRSLEVHVASLRRKIGRGDLIETVRGVGYRLVVG
ncbi:MAG: response regulator transcription factor, partial [Cryobacterium sp.]|nr:response regulator transcription factor [Cryobacterium sp.]